MKLKNTTINVLKKELRLNKLTDILDVEYKAVVDKSNEPPHPNSFVWKIIISPNQYLTNNWTYHTYNSAKQALIRIAKRLNVKLNWIEKEDEEKD